MPPRFQCLNAVSQASRQGLGARSLFSTTSRALAGEESSSAASLLQTIQGYDQTSKDSRLPSRNEPPRFYTDRSSRPNTTSNNRVLNLLQSSESKRSRGGGRSAPTEFTAAALEQDKLATALGKQISRRWMPGDVYAPHDLSDTEMGKWRRRSRPEIDVFDALNMNPLEHYKNFSIMSEYMTPMGRIKHRQETGLKPANQRKIAKAIRRSIGLGLMPSVHRHPEILQKEGQRRNEKLAGERSEWSYGNV